MPSNHIDSPNGSARNLVLSAWQLPTLEKLTMLRVAALAALLEAGLRLFSVRRLARWFRVSMVTKEAQGPESERPPEFTEVERRQIRNVIRLMNHWPFADGSCLRQSMLLAHFLRSHRPTVQIGVIKEDVDIVAHAWIDVSGMSLGRLEGYVALGRNARSDR